MKLSNSQSIYRPSPMKGIVPDYGSITLMLLEFFRYLGS